MSFRRFCLRGFWPIWGLTCFPLLQYDLSASTFSPDGRVFQVEYAMKAVENSRSAASHPPAAPNPSVPAQLMSTGQSFHPNRADFCLPFSQQTRLSFVWRDAFMISLLWRQTKYYKTDTVAEIWRVVASRPAASSPAPSAVRLSPEKFRLRREFVLLTGSGPSKM